MLVGAARLVAETVFCAAAEVADLVPAAVPVDGTTGAEEMDDPDASVAAPEVGSTGAAESVLVAAASPVGSASLAEDAVAEEEALVPETVWHKFGRTEIKLSQSGFADAGQALATQALNVGAYAAQNAVALATVAGRVDPGTDVKQDVPQAGLFGTMLEKYWATPAGVLGRDGMTWAEAASANARMDRDCMGVCVCVFVGLFCVFLNIHKFHLAGTLN
ncbi:hypothetical protein BJ741DRAFT_623483 [Chytriomyces cf. hyalinus JEL632]|nr:hypothetical protein BJ741DRAFT_623483 [Chytriomyces cf. hyalinus JEL632]